jgi:endonuclease/exonuclease/phosphatase family metal-dependent hydrolase
MRNLLFIAAVVLLASCSKDEPVPDTRHSYYKNSHFEAYNDSAVTVVTYNIQLGFTMEQDPWNADHRGGSPAQIHAIAEILRHVDPDFVLLQEVPINRSNVEIEHLIEALADSMNMNFAYGGHGKNDVTWPHQGVWGNAILSKYPIKEIENIEVARENRWDCRSTLRAEIGLRPDLSINLYSLHHRTDGETGIENTLNFVRRSRLPLIFGGDFNRRYGDPDLAMLSDYQDIFGSYSPTIDRIYSGLHDSVLARGFIFSSNYVSDHGAFYARLRLR